MSSTGRPKPYKRNVIGLPRQKLLQLAAKTLPTRWRNSADWDWLLRRRLPAARAARTCALAQARSRARRKWRLSPGRLALALGGRRVQVQRVSRKAVGGGQSSGGADKLFARSERSLARRELVERVQEGSQFTEKSQDLAFDGIFCEQSLVGSRGKAENALVNANKPRHPIQCYQAVVAGSLACLCQTKAP